VEAATRSAVAMTFCILVKFSGRKFSLATSPEILSTVKVSTSPTLLLMSLIVTDFIPPGMVLFANVLTASEVELATRLAVCSILIPLDLPISDECWDTDSASEEQ